MSDCNDNVVISETGVETVVTVSRKERENDEKNGDKSVRRAHQMTARINQLERENDCRNINSRRCRRNGKANVTSVKTIKISPHKNVFIYYLNVI